MISRRSFLTTAGMTIGTVGAVPAWMVRAAAQGRGKKNVLVVIFQRGAADGLNIVIPVFEPSYYALRPTIAVPRPRMPGGAIDLDGSFALHPSLDGLKEWWDRGQLALIPAAGSHDPTRSHFDAQEYMESGTPGTKLEEGWLNRALPAHASSPLRAVAMTPQLPLTLKGSGGALAIDNLQKFEIGRAAAVPELERLYAATANSALRTHGTATFDALRAFDALRRQAYTPANGAQYVGEFGRRLQQIAQLIKGDIGVEVAFADIGGWDHHSNEGPQLTLLLREFGASIAAFARDLGERMADVVLVTMSEFGRTIAENGTAGTDHGHGNLMMVLGGRVRGGIHGGWPGLSEEQRYENRDLAVTTDFRDVLGELVTMHLGQNLHAVFPGYREVTRLGVLKA